MRPNTYQHRVLGMPLIGHVSGITNRFAARILTYTHVALGLVSPQNNVRIGNFDFSCIYGRATPVHGPNKKEKARKVPSKLLQPVPVEGQQTT